MGVYIIKLKVTSENRTDGHDEKDDYTTVIRYKYPKAVRDLIRNIRVNTHQQVYSNLIKFEEGIYIGTDEHLRKIEPILREANEKLRRVPDDAIKLLEEKIEKAKNEGEKEKLRKQIKEIEAKRQMIVYDLYARLKVLPLDEQQIRKGEYYAAVVHAIYHKVIEDVLKRVSRVKADRLSDKAILKLHEMLNSMRELNFLNDESINKRIEELKWQLENHDVATIKIELEKELREIEAKSSMFSYLEL